MTTCKRPTCDMKPQANAKHGYCRKHAKTEHAANTNTPAAPTVARIHTLINAGWSCAAIADTAGASIYAIYDLRDGKHRSVRKTTAEAIARINPHTHTGGAWTPAWPIQRRLCSLQAAGWSQAALATMAGIPQAEISKLTTGRTHVTHRTAQTITTLWDDLAPQPVPGPPTKLAQRRKWVPPMAWDNIDNPDEHHPPLGTLITPTQTERERALHICNANTVTNWPYTEISYSSLKRIATGKIRRTATESIDFIYLESDRIRSRQGKEARRAAA